MLNPQIKLNPKIFDADAEQLATRDGYGEGIVKAGREDKNVVVLCADLTESTRAEAFKKEFPDRFIELGVAEQNMASVASGMAALGKIPFISSYATFNPGRNWEQIRTTICYNERHVIIAGHHSGISVGPDGATHQATEDIATTRVIANMTVVVPCDAIEARKATVASVETAGPVYLRFTREKTTVITTEETPFEIGKAEVFFRSEGKIDVAIIACGPLLANALRAALILEKEGIGAIVLNNHTVKPMDEEAILAVAKEAGCLVTVEEHNVQGGMGSAVAEVLAQFYPTPMEFIGVQNMFGESGAPNELIKKFGMDTDAIYKAAKKAMGRKNKK